jgi:hypothetical protein
MAALAAVGALVSGFGTFAAGVAQKRAADQDALNMEAQGKEEVAASQREAEIKRREGRLINSRAQAVAAASGAGAGTDAPTIVRLMSQTRGESEFNAQSSLYGGFSRKAGLKQGARARRAEGRASLLGGVLGGFGQAASGLGKAFG